MKKAILASLLLISTSLFSQKWEKNDISIEVFQITSGHERISGTAFYKMYILNDCDTEILVSPAIISNSILGYARVEEKIWKSYEIILASSGSLLAIAMLTRRGPGKLGWLGLPGLAYGLYKTKMFKPFMDQVLSKKFTIAPGERITKYFWLKNSNDQVKINFDAIKVL